jgi:hypothetical protein
MCLGWRRITGTRAIRLKLFFLYLGSLSVYNSICSSSLFWPFKRPKQRRFTAMYIYKKRGRVSVGFAQVIRVLLGQLPGGFLLRPGPIPCLGQPGPRSTRRASPGFKTMAKTIKMKIKGLIIQGKQNRPKLPKTLFFLKKFINTAIIF